MTTPPARCLFAAGLVLAAACPAPAADAPPRFAEVLPAERTLVYVELTNWGPGAAFPATDLGRAAARVLPFLRHFAQGFAETDDAKKTDAQRLYETLYANLLSALPGGFALAVVLPPGKAMAQDYPVALIFPATSEPVVSAILTQLSKAPKNPPVGWKLKRHGDFVIVSDRFDALGLGAVGGKEKPLRDDPGFRWIREQIVGDGNALAVGYGRLSVLKRTPVAAYAMQGLSLLQNSKLNIGGSPLNLKGLLSPTVLGIRDVGLGFSAKGGRVREALVLGWAGKRPGLLTMLEKAAPLDVKALAQDVPADTLGLFAVRFDPLAFHDWAAEALAPIHAGATAGVRRMIADFEQRTKLRLRQDLLAAFGDELVMEIQIAESGIVPDVILSAPVRNGAMVRRVLKELGAALGFEIQTIERQGRRIHYFRAPLGDRKAQPVKLDVETAYQVLLQNFIGAWTFEGGRLYTARMPQTLSDRFERLKRGRLSAEPEFQRAVAQAGKEVRGFTWARTGLTVWLVGAFYDLTLNLARLFEPMARAQGIPIDTALLPTPREITEPFKRASLAFSIDEQGLRLHSEGGTPLTATVLVNISFVLMSNALKDRDAKAEDPAAIEKPPAADEDGAQQKF